LEGLLDDHVLGDLLQEGLQVVLLVKETLNQQELALSIELVLVFEYFKSVGLAEGLILEEYIDEDILEHLGLGYFKDHLFVLRLQTGRKKLLESRLGVF